MIEDPELEHDLERSLGLIVPCRDCGGSGMIGHRVHRSVWRTDENGRESEDVIEDVEFDGCGRCFGTGEVRLDG